MSAYSAAAPTVRHYVSGGSEHGGGIGRLVGYVLDVQGTPGRHLLTDTRGPKWNPWVSPWFLAWALGIMSVDRLASPRRIHQLHIAGRGSTARKTILGLWAQAVGARYVMHLHDYDYAADFVRRPEWQRRAIRRVFRGAQHVIVLGQRDRKTVAGLLDVPSDRVSVLRNCVPDPGAPKPRDAGGTARILFLGQLGPRKGVPELLAALADPAMPATGWRATLAGGGPVEDYAAEVERLGLSDRVELTGWLGRDETQRISASADILVLPSHGEGFAMAVLEGLAHGLAVVTTRVGAHDEVLEHDRTCLFVPVGDVHALAVALARLLNDPELRSRLSREGRRLFLSEFGIRRYAEQLEHLHGEIGQGLPAMERQT